MRSPLANIATAVSLLASATASITSNASLLFSNDFTHATNIPSIYESTLQARRILHLSKIATISTIFPKTSALENRPNDVSGSPIGQMEYYASCGPETYNPTLLAVSITTTIKNAKAGSNVTLSLRYHLPSDAPPTDDPWAYFPANLPRMALIGYIEPLEEKTIEREDIRNCFVGTHPEAKIWEPGTDVHESYWARLVVNEVYFFGGFGDRARIGWLPIDTWRRITIDEVQRYRMIGEEGYSKNQVIGKEDALRIQDGL